MLSSRISFLSILLVSFASIHVWADGDAVEGMTPPADPGRPVVGIPSPPRPPVQGLPRPPIHGIPRPPRPAGRLLLPCQQLVELKTSAFFNSVDSAGNQERENAKCEQAILSAADRDLYSVKCSSKESSDVQEIWIGTKSTVEGRCKITSIGYRKPYHPPVMGLPPLPKP